MRTNFKGGPYFGLREVLVAQNLGDGTFGLQTRVPSAQMLNFTLIPVNAELDGDDRKTDTHSQIVKGRAQLRFGGAMTLEALRIITGQAISSSGSGSTLVERISFVPDDMDYFAICGRAKSTRSAGDIHGWGPMCKIVSEFTAWAGQFGNYTIPEVTVDLIADENQPIGGTSEVQTATISGTPAGGTFKLKFMGQETATIAFDAAASAVQTALQALTEIGSGNVTVSGSAGGPYTITFASALALQAVPLISLGTNALTGGTNPTVAIVRTTPGVDAEGTIFVPIRHATAANVVIPPV